MLCSTHSSPSKFIGIRVLGVEACHFSAWRSTSRRCLRRGIFERSPQRKRWYGCGFMNAILMRDPFNWRYLSWPEGTVLPWLGICYDAVRPPSIPSSREQVICIERRACSSAHLTSTHVRSCVRCLRSVVLVQRMEPKIILRGSLSLSSILVIPATTTISRIIVVSRGSNKTSHDDSQSTFFAHASLGSAPCRNSL